MLGENKTRQHNRTLTQVSGDRHCFVSGGQEGFLGTGGMWAKTLMMRRSSDTKM